MMDEWVHSLNWTNDLGITDVRRRGWVRLRTGGLLLVLGAGLAWAGAPAVGGLGALVGVACLPCAVLELLTRRSWAETSPSLRLLFLALGVVAGFPLFFGVILGAVMLKSD